MTELVGLADVRAARELLTGVVRTTPLEPSRPLSAALGGPVLLKCENFQRAGSYKVRGAYTRIAGLTAEGGLVADLKGMWRHLAFDNGLDRWTL